jgi:hypothetical protein
MDVLHNLAFGFEHALTLHNLMFCAIGCVVGTFVGLLPGLGPLATISLLLPLTYSIPTDGALIMLAGITRRSVRRQRHAITMKIPHASRLACIDAQMRSRATAWPVHRGFPASSGTVAILVHVAAPRQQGLSCSGPPTIAR